MRILCDITVLSNNVQPPTSVKHAKATLAISWHPPNKPESELYLILFKNKHQSTQKFRIKDNLCRVFNRFADEGKLTLSFKEPNQSIQIKADPVQLKQFLSTLKLALNCRKEERNRIGLSSLAVTAISTKSHPVTKLTIVNRSDFPTKGLPRTLTHLYINGIRRCKIDIQITFLKQLQVLDVSDNCIAKVPKPIGDMSLRSLNLARNNLGHPLDGCDWRWLGGENLQKSLTTLNLGENNLLGIPLDVFKFSDLVALHLDSNAIKRIPFAIRKLTRLKHLHFSANKLESLPSALEKLRLDSLDLSGNQFRLITSFPPLRGLEIKFPSLFEISARLIELRRIPYSPPTIPIDVFDILSFTPLCRCGKICFNSVVYPKIAPIRLNCSSLTSDSDRASITADCVFCSSKCANLGRH